MDERTVTLIGVSSLFIAWGLAGYGLSMIYLPIGLLWGSILFFIITVAAVDKLREIDRVGLEDYYED